MLSLIHISPSEAFNETVEELTQSLMPLFAKNGMDWICLLYTSITYYLKLVAVSAFATAVIATVAAAAVASATATFTAHHLHQFLKMCIRDSSCSDSFCSCLCSGYR